ncbi:MAG: right-handed parallel beta-helix repeat-containing protein [Bacteroidetes bacterium]|nr:right-handed parallel beta-helix repeat-containing protein [Bacteroidota bacterium]
MTTSATKKSSIFNELRIRIKVLSILGFFIFVSFCNLIAAPMSGIYTIDKSGFGSTNFISFKKAFTALAVNGVSGAVVFNIADDTFTEILSIGAISGASKTSNITFQSASGDSSKVILTYASNISSTGNFTLYLYGAKYITFKKITIQRTGTSNSARVIQLDGGCAHDSFLHCRFIGRKMNTTGGSEQAIFFSGISVDDSNSFIQNHLKYGSFGFCYYGTYSTHETSTIISDNIIDSAYEYGINCVDQDELLISGNKIINSGYSSATGIWLRYFNKSNIIKNQIYLPNGGTGIFADYTYVLAGKDSTFFANNMITMGGTKSIGMNIYYIQGGYANFYNNTVFLTATNGTASTALWLDQQYYTNVINNIFVNLGKGYAVYINHTGRTVFEENYNNLFTNGNYIGYFTGADISTLNNWRAITTYDANSINKNPSFVSATDLHLSSGSLRNGTPFTSIIDDFDGDSRSILPNIGADEIAPYGLDARITFIDSPAISFCA